MYTSMQWENEGPGIFVICKGELPEIKNYPVRLEDEDGTINIRRYAYTEIKGLKPFKEGLQTGRLREGNLELEVKVRYLPIKLTNVSLDKSGQVSYRAGDTFLPDGYTLKAHYSDGHERRISDFLYPTSELKVEQNVVTLSYGCKFCRVPVTVSNIDEMTSQVALITGSQKEREGDAVAAPSKGRVNSVHRTWRFCPFYPSRSVFLEGDRAEHPTVSVLT